MNVKDIKCDYCKKGVKEQVDCLPTWFGRYSGEKLEMVICKDCIRDNKEKWRKGKI